MSYNKEITPPKSVLMSSAKETYHTIKGIENHGPIAFKYEVAKSALQQGITTSEDEAVRIADEEYNHTKRILNGYTVCEAANKNLNERKTASKRSTVCINNSKLLA